MGNAAKTFESRQIFLMSPTARPIALPSCVINGATEILPRRPVRQILVERAQSVFERVLARAGTYGHHHTRKRIAERNVLARLQVRTVGDSPRP